MGGDNVHLYAVHKAEHDYQRQGDQGEDAVEGGHAEVRDLHVLLGFFRDHQTAELLLIHILEPDAHENADADDDHRSNDQLVVGKPIHRGAV